MDSSTNIVQSLTQLTFMTTCLAMGAGAFFFFNEKDRVHHRYRMAMLLATMICGIACVMYFYMREKYTPGQIFPIQLRYFDWLVTTPIMLLEFTALLKLKDKTAAIANLMLWDLVMIVTGYLGETQGFSVGGFQMRWVMFVIGCGGWLGVLVYLYTAIRTQANLSDVETRRCIMLLTKFVTVGWLIYPVGYCVRALFPQYSDACQLLYNVGDAVNKVGFGIVLWAAGIAAVDLQKSHTDRNGSGELAPANAQVSDGLSR